VLGSYLLYRFIGTRQDVESSWLRQFLHPDLTQAALLKHLIFWGTRDSIALDNPIWSLVYETRISLIFPVLFWVTRHWPIKSLVIAWLVSIGCVALRLHMTGRPIAGFDQDNLRQSLVSTAYFVIFFVAGISLAIKREKIIGVLNRLPKAVRLVLLVGALICLFKSSTEIGLTLVVSDYVRAIGAIGLLAIALADKTLQAALSFRIPVWLGRISYSLYLVHVPIIYAVSQLRSPDWSIGMTTVVIIAASLVTADIMARSIEFPFMRIGQKICGKIRYLDPTPMELRDGRAIGATRSSIIPGH
jgi:peptidoglycan/LPS O-acetylase OafA/YrhL